MVIERKVNIENVIEAYYNTKKEKHYIITPNNIEQIIGVFETHEKSVEWLTHTKNAMPVLGVQLDNEGRRILFSNPDDWKTYEIREGEGRYCMNEDGHLLLA
jgi:hypothetical protein